MASIFKSPRVTAIPSLRASSHSRSAGASKRHSAHYPTDTGAWPETGRRVRRIQKTLWKWQIATVSSGIMDEICLVKHSQKGSQTLALLQGLLATVVEGDKAKQLVARLDETLVAMSSMLNTLLDVNQIDA